ncbi:ABC transporter permease [candidate division KSB1 bacterium]|nr:ABC transporter permease [candidate division KSB1 bacterium]
MRDKKKITIVHSLFYYISLIFIMLLVVFLLFTALPADPVRLMLGVNASEHAVSALRHELGLDQPLFQQFFRYIKQLLIFELGTSYVTHRPVAGQIMEAFAITGQYVIIAIGASMTASLLFFRLFFNRQKSQKIFYGICSFFTSIPGLIIAVGFGVLFLKIDILAFIPSMYTRNLLMASIVLSVYPTCSLYQILVQKGRAVQKTPFITAAASYGFSERIIFLKYLLPHSLLPWLAQLSNIAASLLAGSVFIELVFSLPGVGRLVAQSVLRHDYPMMQGIVLLTSFFFILINFCFDRLYRLFMSA